MDRQCFSRVALRLKMQTIKNEMNIQVVPQTNQETKLYGNIMTNLLSFLSQIDILMDRQMDSTS